MVRIAQVEPSGRTVLGCAGCGGRLVLVGLEEDWRSEGRTTFGCTSCGEELTFDDRLGDEELAARENREPFGADGP